MLKLKKISSTEWRGNGFGTANASWVVVGYENISVIGNDYGWVARDTNNGRFLSGGRTRKECVKVLEQKFKI